MNRMIKIVKHFFSDVIVDIVDNSDVFYKVPVAILTTRKPALDIDADH